MAKNKFGRSDIPFKDRLLLNKYTTIAEHRDHSASVVLRICAIRANRDLGLGYMRLAKFVRGCQKMITQYYEDPDYYEEKLNQGMEQLGFKVINGKIFVAVDEEGNVIPMKVLEENGNA
jgi:hypothetical protein